MTQDAEFPRWASICDAVVCALVAVWPFVVVSGGFQVHVAGVRVFSMTSAWRVLLWAGVLAAVRHLFVRSPSFPQRVLATAPELFVAWRVAIARTAYVASVALFLIAVSRYYETGVGLTELIDFGDQFQALALPAVRNVPHYVHVDSAGYDGQFYAQLAVDPLLRDPASRVALDTAAFRARRILFSWSAYLLGAGRPYWILQAYAAQNIACWLLLAWVLTRWFPPGDVRNFCAWFACLFSVGLILSVRRALTDGPSMLLISLALVAFERNRTWLAAAVLGVSGLGRETNVLAGAMLVPTARWQVSSILRLLAYGCMVVIPLALWMQHVHAVYQAYDTGIGAFGAPMTGYVRAWRTMGAELGESGWWGPARHTLYALISLTVQTLYLACRPSWRSPWWRVGVMYALLMTLVGPAVWDGYPTAATRASLPLTFAFNILLVRDKWFWPLLVPGNLTIISGLATIDLWSPSNYI